MDIDQVANMNDPAKINYAIQIPFACEKYAETAMRSIGVEPAFSDSKNKKTSITRQMEVQVLEDGIAYLIVNFYCDNEQINSMRTCASSFFTNMMLVCETMAHFGN